jgi:hypothetical protein
MKRVIALAAFLLRDLHRTPAGAAPYALAAGLAWLTFYYPVSSDYLAAVGGWDLAVVALVTTLALAGRADRAAFFPLVGRLRCRSELPAAVWLAGAAVMTVIAVAFAAAVAGTGRLTDGSAASLWVAPRWLLVMELAGAAGLNLSRLVSRGGSHLVAAALAALLATSATWRGILPASLAPIAEAAVWLMSPVATLLSAGATPVDAGSAAAVAGYAVALAAVGVALFNGKDLLWPE